MWVPPNHPLWSDFSTQLIQLLGYPHDYGTPQVAHRGLPCRPGSTTGGGGKGGVGGRGGRSREGMACGDLSTNQHSMAISGS